MIYARYKHKTWKIDYFSQSSHYLQARACKLPVSKLANDPHTLVRMLQLYADFVVRNVYTTVT